MKSSQYIDHRGFDLEDDCEGADCGDARGAGLSIATKEWRTRRDVGLEQVPSRDGNIYL